MFAITLIICGVVAVGSGVWMLGKERSPSLDQKSMEDAIAAALKDANFSSKEERLIRDTANHEGKNPEPIIKKIKEDFKASEEEPETGLIDVNAKAGLDFEKFIVILASRKKNIFNESDWLKDLFKRTQSHKQKDLYQLLPSNLEEYRPK
ncbi:hypothetical protein [Mongoliibacter ruber]|uniref:Uncharacterized protein n=1 Tax=Mongoliibacter ruber TaxID=1750599 RepID=A0A2T0WPL0_9BACT|nr:hypothetical protein [Mongoliibacter ruber]PRY88627.1 hypothetical protein CLW00_104278 [Mongoliibacter ruber]